jgi:hypothetical protein
LKPGKDYQLRMLYFGSYEARFCETILLQITVQPLTSMYNYDYCAGHTTIGPENTRTIVC